MNNCKDKTLSIISGMYGSKSSDGISLHFSFGRIVDGLASDFAKTYLSIPICSPDTSRDYILTNPVKLIAQPCWKKTIQGIKHPIGIIKACKNVVDKSDVIFVRGLFPYLPFLYLYARVKSKPVVHWVVGNPTSLLKIARRNEGFGDKLSLYYAKLEDVIFRYLKNFKNAYFVTNGCELYEKFKTPRTKLVVSSTLKEDEFYYRDDTCQAEPIKILFISFVRPEKGLEYLIEAISKLKTNKQIKLIIGGGTTFEKYVNEIKTKIKTLNLEDRIEWLGHLTYPQVIENLKQADIFVLPTLSEGTPRVLVEARAMGLPIVSTTAGGIPSSVTNNVDGILIPPKNSDAIADAIDRIISDEMFRKQLIRNGYEKARELTLEKFVGRILSVIESALEGKEISDDKNS